MVPQDKQTTESKSDENHISESGAKEPVVHKNLEIKENICKHDMIFEKKTEEDGAILIDKQTTVEIFDIIINTHDVENCEKLKENLIWKQSLAASVPILLTMVAGFAGGYSSTLIPQLKEEAGSVPSDIDAVSWIASSAALPIAPGCLLAGWMLEKFGRRNSHYFVCVILFAGWILIASANNLTLIVTGRVLTGLCIGLLGPLSSVYIGEIASPKYRGFFLAGISLAIAVGIFIVNCLGIFMSWRWIAGVGAVITALTSTLLFFIPESPTWLVSRDRLEDATASFLWLRGSDKETKAEFKAMVESNSSDNCESKVNPKCVLSHLRNNDFLKPLVIMIILFLTCELSGVNAVVFYTTDIIDKAVGKDVDNYLSMLVMDALRLVFSFAACVISKQYGRRPMFIISGVFTGSSLVTLSLFLYFKPLNMSWFPLACLFVYTSAISLGIIPVLYMICGEIFPTRFRGLGTGITNCMEYIVMFLIVKTAPFIFNDLGDIFAFLFYGLFVLLGCVILYFILPETNGKSLNEIEKQFLNSKLSINSNVKMEKKISFKSITCDK